MARGGELTRHRILGFTDPRSGEWRELRDPDGQPSGTQLRRLNRDGRLALVPPGAAEPLTKSEAAYAIDAADETAGNAT